MASGTVATTRVLGGIAEALRDRNFRVYSVGSLVSWLGVFVQFVAIAWTTWELTHSTAWLATMSVLDIAPGLVLLPLGGVLADRSDRLRIVFVTGLLALLQAATLAALSATSHLTVGWLAVLAVLHGSIHSFGMPGSFGMLPRFVARERLASAIAINAGYAQFALFAGPALAGWLIARGGVTFTFVVNAAGYAVYLASLALLRTPDGYVAAPPSGMTVTGDLIGGFRYITGHRGIRAILALMLVGDALSGALTRMLPAFADEVLGHGVDGFATLLAAAGLGSTAAALWLAQGGIRRATTGRVLTAFLLTVGSMAAVALAPTMTVAAIACFTWGLSGGVRRIGTVSLFQTRISDAQRGRVMSTQYLLQRAAGGLGGLLVGAAATGAGLRLPMLIGAGLAVLAWAWAFASRDAIGSAFVPQVASDR